MPAAILATAVEKPTGLISPTEQFSGVAAHYGLDKEIIEKMTGIKSRWRSEKDQQPSALATAAARQALQKAKITPAHITTLIFCGVYHDDDEPSTITRTAKNLGVEAHCDRYDLRNACHGMSDAINVAKGLIASGSSTYVLICAGEKGSHQADIASKYLLKSAPEKKKLMKCVAAFTLGCNGSAVLVGPSGPGLQAVIGGREYRADSSQYDLSRVSRVAKTVLKTDARKLENAIVPLARSAVFKLLMDNGLTDAQIDHWIIHQTGKTAVAAHNKMLRMSPGTLAPHYQYTGNLITGSLAFGLNEIWPSIAGKKIIASIQGGGIVASALLLNGICK